MVAPRQTTIGGVETSGGHLVMKPETVGFAGVPGDEAVASVWVANATVHELALDQPGRVGFRRPGALARGVREGFIDARGDFVARLIALGKRLEQEEAIELEYAFAADFDALKPGASGRVEIRLRIPKFAASVTGWTARLPLLGTTLPATLDIDDGRPQPKPNAGGPT